MARTTLLMVIFFFLHITIWGETIIVPQAMMENKDFRLASNFLNQYAELLLSDQSQEVKDKIRRTKEDGFTYMVANDLKFLNLTGTEDFRITVSNYKYNACWSINGITLVECVFPANIEMLTFSNKIDLENQMINKLKENAQVSSDIQLPIVNKENLKKVALSDFYVCNNEFYITPRLKNQMVYMPIPCDTINCQMLIDSERYPIESLSNMMLSGYSANPQIIKLKINQYGHKNSTIEIPLSNLYEIFASEGCTPYWGVDTFDGEIVSGVYIWINSYGGYAHMLTINIPIKSVSEGASSYAKLHSYLRLDNLKTLFEEYEVE